MKNTIISVVAVLALVAGVLAYMKPATVERIVGAVTGPEDSFQCKVSNGVETCSARQRFNRSATTTVCSLKGPAATSTLIFGSLALTTGSTTAMQYEVGKSSSFAATTTSLGLAQVASGALVTLIASSSPEASKGAAVVFGPNNYFNAIHGGALPSASVVDGTCVAEWRIN